MDSKDFLELLPSMQILGLGLHFMSWTLQDWGFISLTVFMTRAICEILCDCFF